jgi:hypothetical protein
MTRPACFVSESTTKNSNRASHCQLPTHDRPRPFPFQFTLCWLCRALALCTSVYSHKAQQKIILPSTETIFNSGKAGKFWVAAANHRIPRSSRCEPCSHFSANYLAAALRCPSSPLQTSEASIQKRSPCLVPRRPPPDYHQQRPKPPSRPLDEISSFAVHST